VQLAVVRLVFLERVLAAVVCLAVVAVRLVLVLATSHAAGDTAGRSTQLRRTHPARATVA
jgi:hypothetical protein